jgi:protein-S-isoprenylcysteine O-methyltransferase Ste14
MIEFSLISYSLLLAVVFGLRPWMQYRRTGDHGFRGFSGRTSPLERLSGLLFAIALTALFGAPIATLTSVVGSAELPGWISILGVVLALAGFAVVVVAQYQMGASWRVGVDRSERTVLIRDGLFALVRNPVFSGIGMFAVGFSLLVANVLSGSALLLGAVGLEIQARWVEEPYLQRTHGAAYAEYARRVGRFLPGIGRLSEWRAA